MDSKSKPILIGAIVALIAAVGVIAIVASNSPPESGVVTVTQTDTITKEGQVVTTTIVTTAQRPPVGSAGKITIYSGRAENLIGPVIKRFEQETGIKAEVRYGDTAALALTIIEEGKNSPADLFFAQDAGALGALSKQGRLTKISEPLLDKVDPDFQSPSGEWIGITGRARTVDYNTKLVDKSEMPDSIWSFLEPKWKGEIGWSPPNGSFQSFITALRKLEGEDRAKQWLLGIMANEPKSFPSNTAIIEALGRGEISVGFVNNYYLHRYQSADPAFPVAHHYTKGDAGSMINVAGLGIVDITKNKDLAEKFIEYMLSQDAQLYFATNTYEYPLLNGTQVLGPQLPLKNINTPKLDLSDIDDLKGTLALLKEVGAL